MGTGQRQALGRARGGLDLVDLRRAVAERLDGHGLAVLLPGRSRLSLRRHDRGERRSQRDGPLSIGKRAAVRDINAIHPDVLFATNFSFSGGKYTPVAWGSAVVRQMEQVKQSGAKVVLLASPPMTPDPATCYTPRSVPADCAGTPPDSWLQMATTQQHAAEQLGGKWVDSRPWFCAFDECPAFADTTPIRIDVAHMGQPYGQKIEPVIAESLRSAGILQTR